MSLRRITVMVVTITMMASPIFGVVLKGGIYMDGLVDDSTCGLQITELKEYIERLEHLMTEKEVDAEYTESNERFKLGGPFLGLDEFTQKIKMATDNRKREIAVSEKIAAAKEPTIETIKELVKMIKDVKKDSGTYVFSDAYVTVGNEALCKKIVNSMCKSKAVRDKIHNESGPFFEVVKALCHQQRDSGYFVGATVMINDPDRTGVHNCVGTLNSWYFVLSTKELVWEVEMPGFRFLYRRTQQFLRQVPVLQRLGISILYVNGALVVNSVQHDSDGYKVGLRASDVITHVNGQKVYSPWSLCAKMDRAVRQGKKIKLTKLKQ